MRFPMRCDQYELRPEPAAPGQVARRDRDHPPQPLPRRRHVLVRGRPPDRPAARRLRRLGRARRLVPQEPGHAAGGGAAGEGDGDPVRGGRVHRVPRAERGRLRRPARARPDAGARGRARRLHDDRARPRRLRRRLRGRADARDRRGGDRGAPRASCARSRGGQLADGAASQGARAAAVVVARVSLAGEPEYGLADRGAEMAKAYERGRRAPARARSRTVAARAGRGFRTRRARRASSASAGRRVREALRLLAAQSLIRTAKGAGGGSYVTLPSAEHVSESLALGDRAADRRRGRDARGAARGARAARGAGGAARGAAARDGQARAAARGDPARAAAARAAGAVRLQRGLPHRRDRGLRQRAARDRGAADLRRAPDGTWRARRSAGSSTARSTSSTATIAAAIEAATRVPPATRCTRTSSTCARTTSRPGARCRR